MTTATTAASDDDTRARRRAARVASIDAGRPFLPTLAAALLDGDLIEDFHFDADDPAALADVLVLVPTRRAARALADAFRAELARRGAGRAALLPEIRPFGDVDEDGELFAEEAIDLEPVISPLERRLAMTRLVMGWTRSVSPGFLHPVTGAMPSLPASPAEAVRLAGSLSTLMDQVESQGADWRRLTEIVPEEHAFYWQMTLAFLSIVTDAWPRHLTETGREDPARRRHAAIRATAKRFAEAPPKGPVIAAGSTGSVPSTAELIATIGRLPRGAVVVPGLDFDLDEAVWTSLEPEAGAVRGDPVPGHPQYGLRLLLDRLGVDRAAVRRIGGDDDGPAAARRRLLSQALLPAEATDAWRAFADEIAEGRFPLEAALDGFGLIEARHEAEEAVAVALILREALEDPKATAALVTPDRNLARRVAAELTRWGLEIDDSAGRPFGHTAPAVLTRLVGEVALGGWEPVGVAALLGHPLARFGRPAEEARRLARAAELVALRGARPLPGGAGLLAAFDEAAAEIADEPHRVATAKARLGAETIREARALLGDLVAALAPLEALDGIEETALPIWVETHVAAVRWVARDETGSDAALFEGEEGEALARAFANLIEAARGEGAAITLPGSSYPGFFDALVGDQPVNRRTAAGARVFVFGPLEARLLSFDTVVLAGLDEGIWPITTRVDPWLSRPMRRDMGLEAPERRIGLAAHDFVQGAAARRVILARAARSGGTPTVPSRWLQRIATVIGEGGRARLRAATARPLAWARMLDRADGPPRPVGRPAPRPPLELRPISASVTEIERWIRDPYALHARRILKIDVLDPIGGEIGASERGMLVHDVLEAFVKSGESVRGARALEVFTAMADAKLAAWGAFPEIVALWRPRLTSIATWWLEAEAARDGLVASRRPEVKGRLTLEIDGVPFTLTGRADRIDLLHDGRITLLDYKTGRPPSEAQVQSLLSPQLALEAAMARAGAFDGALGFATAGRDLAEIAYLHLSGGRDGGKWEERGRSKDGRDPHALAEAALEALIELVRAFRRAETGYPSRPRVQFEKAREGDYDHLARVAEWAAGESGDGGEA